MKKLKKNQSGFSAIEVVLVLVIVAVLGLGGWYVWDNRNNKSSTSTKTTTTTKVGTPNKSSSPQTATTTKTQLPANCPKVAQGTAVAVFITLNSSGADQPCVQVSKDETVAIQNHTNSTVIVVLGDRTRTAPSGYSTGFDGPVGDYLHTGENKMNVSIYASNQYPSIWVY